MQATVRQIDRVIQQCGTSVGAIDGCDLVALTDQQEQSLRSLLTNPNGGIVLNSDGSLAALPVPVPQPAPDQAAFDAAVSQLRNTFNTARSAAQVNGSLDALTVILRRAWKELQ